MVFKIIIDFVKNGFPKILFVSTVSLGIVFFNSCKENPVDDSTNPPCIDCPFDFRLTDFEPTWSPDGKTIAYVHGDTIESKTGIFLIDTTGLNKRLLISSAFASSPSWSPEGEWIVFSMSAQIYKIKVTGDSLTQLTDEGRNFFPSWSPDGQWIAYDSNNDSPNGMNFIWKIKKDGTNKIRIAYDPTKGEIRMPSWSKENNYIYHIRYIGIGTPEIFRMDENGNNLIRITYNEKTEYYPKYNETLKKVVFESRPYASFPLISTVNENGNNFKELTEGSTCDWSPDGKYIVYTYSRSVSGMLWIIKNDGSDKRQLTFDN